VTGWVLIAIILTSGALPGARMISAPFVTRTACEAALADLRRQLVPASHLQPQPRGTEPRIVAGCYQR